MVMLCDKCHTEIKAETKQNSVSKEDLRRKLQEEPFSHIEMAG